MLDLTSSAYLGLRHGNADLGPWQALTTERPAALGGALLADRAARAVATLQGREDGIAAASTLHLATDLFTAGLPPGAEIWWDAHLYPVMRCALAFARPARRGGCVPAHDPRALARRLAPRLRGGAVPVFATDGYCVECARPAPLAALLRELAPHGGLMVVDDTQALGILGTCPSTADPFGLGGGGTVCALPSASAGAVIVVTSLAKAFGAPMAVLAGPGSVVSQVRAHGLSRVHCSPPAIPAALAALRALALNERFGRPLRRRLARSLRIFRGSCRARGLLLAGGFHPVQTLRLAAGSDVLRLGAAARDAGLAVVPCEGADGAPSLRLVVTARHDEEELARAAAVIAGLMAEGVSPANAAAGPRPLRRPVRRDLEASRRR